MRTHLMVYKPTFLNQTYKMKQCRAHLNWVIGDRTYSCLNYPSMSCRFVMINRYPPHTLIPLKKNDCTCNLEIQVQCNSYKTVDLKKVIPFER